MKRFYEKGDWVVANDGEGPFIVKVISQSETFLTVHVMTGPCPRSSDFNKIPEIAVIDLNKTETFLFIKSGQGVEVLDLTPYLKMYGK